MHDCMKRRLLYASAQAYQPDMEVHRRTVGWIGRPTVVRRGLDGRAIDVALVGEVREGVVVAFRGSLPPFFGGRHDGWDVVLDWLGAGLAICVDASEFGGGVHLGFAESVRRLWDDADGGPGIASQVEALLAQGARRHLFVAGHSKGGALANLFAVRAAREAAWRDLPVSVATFAAARAGNGAFAKSYAASRIVCLRYELPGDLVPQLPPGPGTPGWVRGLARQIAPGIADADWHAVGTPMAAVTAGRRRWEGSRRRLLPRLLGRRGPGLEALMPGVLTAHAICPGSSYDRLVCAGEADCSHGR